MEEQREKIERLEKELQLARDEYRLECRREIINNWDNPKSAEIDITTQESTVSSIKALLDKCQQESSELRQLADKLGVPSNAMNIFGTVQTTCDLAKPASSFKFTAGKSKW